MIFGAVVDEAMGDEIRLTVIATGFEHTLARRQVLQQSFSRSTPAPPTPVPARLNPPAEKPKRQVPAREREPVQPKFSTSNLDIPAFLRRR